MLLPLWVTAFVAGAVAGLFAAGWLAGAVAVVALGLGVWRLARRGRALGGAALALAAGVARGACALPDPGAADLEPADLEAIVRRGPDAAGPDRAHLIADLVAPARGRVAVTLPGAARDVAPGDRVRFRAALRVPRGLANPGLPDARLAATAQGLEWTALVPAREPLAVVARGSPLAPRRVAHRLRAALSRAIVAAVPAAPAALLRTVVLGERAEVGDRVEDGFRAAGATHVLSVSGLHLAAVAAVVFWALRLGAGLVPALALRVAPARVAALLALPVVALYTLLTGEAVATERSALMAAAALVATALARPLHGPSAIATAALILVVRAPLAVIDVSFQLTFASVIALAVFARGLAPDAAGAGASWRRRAAVWLGRFTAASVAASLCTAPLVAHHFGEITPAAPVGNLALVPLVELLVLPLGLGGALVASVAPAVGAWPLRAAGWVGQLALVVAELFRRAAPVVLVRAPDVFETVALVAASAALLAGVTRPRGRRARWLLVAMASALLAASSLIAREIARRSSRSMRVTFLDVGQGDAAVIEGPGGSVILIDGGGTVDGAFDPGARVIEPFLRARGIPRIDLVVLSHAHPDHLNGLLRVLRRFPVGALWTNGDDARNPVYHQLVALARERGVATPPPAATRVGELRLAPLGPWLDDRIAAAPGTGANDGSLVVRVEHAGRRVLFAGDVEEDGEAELVGRAAAGLAVASDVLKVPHHGSRTSSSAELVDVIRPQLAVMSLGWQNRFHFPHPEVLARYHTRGVRVLRTDRDGAVTVTIGESGAIDATCARGCR